MTTRSSTAASVLLSFGCFLHAVAAAGFSSCEYRLVDMLAEEGSYQLGVFHCMTDFDLYVCSTVDTSLRLRTDSNISEVRDAIMMSPNNATIQNFAASFQQGRDRPAAPRYLTQWAGNWRLECGSTTVYQGNQMQPPTNFLFTLSPVQNPLGQLWQLMGAAKYEEPLLPDTITFGIMHGWGVSAASNTQQWPRPLIDIETAQECLANGTMRVVPDVSSPAWRLCDMNGNSLDTTPVVVQSRNLTCSRQDFDDHVATRKGELFQILEDATSRDEFNSGVMSYATLVGAEVYQGCERILHRLYNTTTRAFRFRKVRWCQNPANSADPCCNKALRWSDCCVPRDHDVNVDGMFDQALAGVIMEECPGNEAVVTDLLDGPLRTILLSQRSPTSPCSANSEKIQIGNDDRRWRQLRDPLANCVEDIRQGKTKGGQDECTDGSECWSETCTDEGDRSVCSRPEGSGLAEPVLLCMLESIDADVWQFVAQILDVDSTVINKDGLYTDEQLEEAVRKFKRRVTMESCSGETANGWCRVPLNKMDCNLLSRQKAGQARALRWLDNTNTSNPNDGYCIIDEQALNWASKWIGAWSPNSENTETCQEVIQMWGDGACSDPVGKNWPPNDQGACSGGQKQWVSINRNMVRYTRLASAYVWSEDETGFWSRSLELGDQTLCELEKICNWDRRGQLTGGDEQKCLTAQNLTRGSPPRDVYLPASEFEENGKKMACLQCWGGRHCESFWPAQPPTCVVNSGRQDTCDNSGGGPDDLPPVQPRENSDGNWYQCQRGLSTVQSCLDVRICPRPPSEEDRENWGAWRYECSERFCYNPNVTDRFECWDYLYGPPVGMGKGRGARRQNPGVWISGRWDQAWNQSNGLCKVWFVNEGGMGSNVGNSRSECESRGLAWWEGRIFKEGTFDTRQKCRTYCNDRTWPPKATCDPDADALCTASCPRCMGDNQYGRGVCANLTATDADSCPDGDYVFNKDAQVCYLENLNRSACEDQGSDHRFLTCEGRGKRACRAYCRDRSINEEEQCWRSNRWWLWDEQHCAYPNHEVDRRSAPRCNTFTDQSQCGDEPGCYWDGNAQSGQCKGESRGCLQRSNAEWVTGDNAQDDAIRAFLRCEWRDWEPCPTRNSCEVSGQCEDWQYHRGACVVPVEPNDEGYAKNCDELTMGDLQFEWANRAGCIAKHDTGERVNESACSDLTMGAGVWRERARTRQECMGHGQVCTVKFNEWNVLGGFTNRSECEGKCKHDWLPKTQWRSGQWRRPKTMPLYWVEREFTSVNNWESDSFSRQLFEDLIERGISRMVSEAHKQRIYCLMLLTNYVGVIADLCNGTASATTAQVVVSTVAEKSLVCSNLENQEPITGYEAIVNFVSAVCDGNTTYTNAVLERVTVLGGGARRLLDGRRLQTICAEHEVIYTAEGHLAGQLVGSPMRASGANGFELCLNPTVEQICSDNTIPDIVTMSEGGEYSSPLGATVTVSDEGYYCFNSTVGGTNYAPVLLKVTPLVITTTTTTGTTTSMITTTATLTETTAAATTETTATTATTAMATTTETTATAGTTETTATAGTTETTATAGTTETTATAATTETTATTATTATTETTATTATAGTTETTATTATAGTTETNTMTTATAGTTETTATTVTTVATTTETTATAGQTPTTTMQMTSITAATTTMMAPTGATTTMVTTTVTTTVEADATITGNVDIQIGSGSPSDFANCPACIQALKNLIANLTGAPVGQIELSINVNRRLGDDGAVFARRLQGTVTATYIITVKQSEAQAAADQITATPVGEVSTLLTTFLEEEGVGQTYTVTVTGVTAPVVEVVTTTPEPETPDAAGGLVVPRWQRYAAVVLSGLALLCF